MAIRMDFAAPLARAPLPRPSYQRFAAPGADRGGEVLMTADGRPLRLRTIAPDDVAALQRCFRRLSSQDIRRRFLHAMSELPEPMAQRLCQIDGTRESALVLLDDAVSPYEIRGVGRVFVDATTDSAEFSLLVEQAWSRLGLGAQLMQRLIADCRKRKLAELWGCVLLENQPMLDLCRDLGFEQHLLTGEPGTARVTLQLSD